jgi:diaminohydroxyphosphoribosylaminopyrimidine deaminase/5-amino-6-(5-phosphoribosylamino)uracil reductase
VLIRSGIHNVVIGTIDPNPEHNGRGIGLLEQAGITVRAGVLEDECQRLNEGFNKWIVTGRPFVIAKCGMSLDGRLTRPPGESRWLTGPAARRHARTLRARVDAILVGAETVRADDPRLTVRAPNRTRQPLRVVLTRSGKLPRTAHVFSDPSKDRTLVYRRQPLSAVLADLGQRQVTSVLIEGGGDVLGQALDQRLIDKLHVYLAPIFTGGPIISFGGLGAGSTGEAPRLDQVSFTRIGSDMCVSGYLRYQAASG